MSDANNIAISKYLADYAEPGNKFTLDSHYQFSLVVPAHQESADQVVNIWRNITPGTSFIVILVINSDLAEDPESARLAEAITQGRDHFSPADDLILATGGPALANKGPDILILDRYSKGKNIAPRQGVGLARKLGTDIALRLHHQGIIESGWLFTTDADATLPADYFAVSPKPSDAALLFPFQHTASVDLARPVLLYEINMLYYAAGLKWAGSPYGYPTVGSTITCSATAYAGVRGYPKRNTGEDFYLLNKLRKLGDVRPIQHTPIVLEGRLSTRVPIGTGQAIGAISRLRHPMQAYRFDHPSCFGALRDFQSLIATLARQLPPRLPSDTGILGQYCRKVRLGERYEKKRKENPTEAVMLKYLHDWFDGLRTRQFIHHFRDQHFGTVSFDELSLGANRQTGEPSGSHTAEAHYKSTAEAHYKSTAEAPYKGTAEAPYIAAFVPPANDLSDMRSKLAGLIYGSSD